MKKNIKIIFWLYFLLFFLLILNLLKFKFFESDSLVSNPYNPRMNGTETTIKRGTIFDRNGEVLAYSEMPEGSEEEKYERKYIYPKEFSHIVGFTSNGKLGVESTYNFYLEMLTNELWQRLSNAFFSTPLQADSIYLTLDKDLQLKAYELLGNNNGAIVVMEPDTGKILAMASYPNFDPNTIYENWKVLDDAENSPLTNRATQGLYPPGSTFKIITASSAIENIDDIELYRYDCKGKAEFGENIIHCFNSKAHGNVDLYGAMAYSCNAFFAETGMELGGERLRVNAENALFNKALGYELEYNKSQFELSDFSQTSEIIETSIGQGKTLVTPLHMTMITSAVANNGIMMKPYLLDYIEAYNSKTKKKRIPKMQAQPFSADTANEIAQMMEKAVEEGTGVGCKIDGISVAGKTGTAENSSGDDHAWFTAFAPAQSPRVCVTVMLENAGSGSNAVPAARELIKLALSLEGGI